MDTLTYENMARKLVDYVPELEAIYQHEIDYYNGEISIYVFFGVLLKDFLIALIEKGAEQSLQERECIEKIFEFIEQCATSPDKAVLDVIYAGFLEIMIPYTIAPYPNYQTVLDYMKPQTKVMRLVFF